MLIGTRPNGGRQPVAPSKVANNEDGDKSIESVKQYVLIGAGILRESRANADRIYISGTLCVSGNFVSRNDRNYCANIPEKKCKQMRKTIGQVIVFSGRRTFHSS